MRTTGTRGRRAIGRGRPLLIGELAATVGLNPKTVRYYEEIGLLPGPPRTPAGYRLYGETDLQRLRFIVQAKAIGFSLEQVREILALREAGQAPCGHVLALLDRRIADVDAQLRALGEVRTELAAMREAAAHEAPADGCVCGIIEHHAPPHPLPLVTGIRRPEA